MIDGCIEGCATGRESKVANAGESLLNAALADQQPIMDLEQRAVIRWNSAYLIELCRRATERVFAIVGV